MEGNESGSDTCLIVRLNYPIESAFPKYLIKANSNCSTNRIPSRSSLSITPRPFTFTIMFSLFRDDDSTASLYFWWWQPPIHERRFVSNRRNPVSRIDSKGYDSCRIPPSKPRCAILCVSRKSTSGITNRQGIRFVSNRSNRVESTTTHP